MFRVIFRDDTKPDEDKGKYILSSKEFTSPATAQHYADTIAQSREPIVVIEYAERPDDEYSKRLDVIEAARKYNEKYPLQPGD